MASISSYETKSGRRFMVQWRTSDHKARKKRGFKTKREAELWRAKTLTAINEGTYVEPSASDVSIGVLGPRWLASKKSVSKPTYWRDLESAWRVHVEPRWGKVAVGSIRHSDVQTWVSGMAERKSASVVLRAFGVLKGICDTAIDDKRIAVSPCERISLPRKMKRALDRRYLTARELLKLEHAAGYWGPLVAVLGWCGLRWGEAVALTVGCIDLDKRRIRIRASVSRVGSEYQVSPPKTWEVRDVPITDHVSTLLMPLVAGREASAPLFLDMHGNRPVQQIASVVAAHEDVKQWWGRALRLADLKPLKIHELRHTAASLAVSSGANVKLVQRMLGHNSAAITLDTYTDLFDRDMDKLIDDLDRLISDTVVEL